MNKQLENVDRQAELSNCNFAKTILMLLIVFYHSILFWAGDWFTQDPVVTSNLLSGVATWLNSFHIYAFTLVSGYIFYCIKHEKGRYEDFPAFVKNKVTRLLIPYVFIAIVWVIPIHCMFFGFDVQAILNKYVLATGPSQLWFLVMLFNVFVIFWPLSNFFRCHNLAGAIVVLSLYGCGLIGDMLFPNVFMTFTALQYTLFFWLGFKLRQYGIRRIRKIPALIWTAASILLVGCAQYLGGYESIVCKVLKIGVSFASRVVGALMAFVILQRIADRINWNNKCFAFLSKRSMTVYLFHQQVIYFLIHWLNGTVTPSLNAVINFAGALAISLAIASLLMKFRITRFLIGEK